MGDLITNRLGDRGEVRYGGDSHEGVFYTLTPWPAACTENDTSWDETPTR